MKGPSIFRYVQLTKHKGTFVIIVFFTMLFMNSCKKFLNISPPPSKIPAELVFQDEATAISAIVGLYIDLYSGIGFAAGTNQSIVSLAGLSSDELVNNRNDPFFLQFQNNNINSSAAYVENLWLTMYKSVYEANSAIEGVEASKILSASVKSQLKGEALFIRAFCYFYLTNFFGNVPLAISTDYQVNNQLKRDSSADVYNRIIADLVMAEDLLSSDYIVTDRIRANKFAATALLSRVYLYTGDWARANDKASNVIANTALYNLPNLSEVFLSTSKEAIWQLRPNDLVSYANEGYWFSTLFGPSNNILREDIMSIFEVDDNRKSSWTTSVTAGGKTVYLPYKYKRFQADNGPTNEYSMVLKLAEVYLIRAEARLRLDNFSGAISDIDKIRHRAGLPLIKDVNPSISEEDLLLAIEKERRIELLAEWGHRWLDLKRWNRSENVLGAIKSGWSNNDLLYPVPTNEINKNQNLKPQNPGY